jgi:hypothetical protein
MERRIISQHTQRFLRSLSTVYGRQLFVSSNPLQDIKEILSSYLGSEPALNEINWTIVDADDKPAVFLDVSVSLGRSSECGGKRRLITSTV